MQKGQQPEQNTFDINQANEVLASANEQLANTQVALGSARKAINMLYNECMRLTEEISNLKDGVPDTPDPSAKKVKKKKK